MAEKQAAPKCGTCNDTGQAWTPEQDGSGMWDMACPDCDTPYQLPAVAPESEAAPREICGSCDAGLPMPCTCPADAADDGDGVCEHDCDEVCELEGCNHQHCWACGECGCAGYCDDYQTYNLRPAETGGQPAPKEG